MQGKVEQLYKATDSHQVKSTGELQSDRCLPSEFHIFHGNLSCRLPEPEEIGERIWGDEVQTNQVETLQTHIINVFVLQLFLKVTVIMLKGNTMSETSVHI